MGNVKCCRLSPISDSSGNESFRSVIFSTSQTTNSILDVLHSNKEFEHFRFIGILDDNPDSLNKYFFGLPVVAKFSDIEALRDNFNVKNFSIGLAAVKHMNIKGYLFNYCLSLGLRPIDAIHKTVYISPSSKIGCGQLILPFTSISPDCNIGNNCSIHSNVSILEKCSIGNNVTIAGNSFIGGHCRIFDNVYIGPGSVISSGVSIGQNTIVGAGSTVLKDLPENTFCFGNPINKMRENNKYLEPKKWMDRTE